MADKLTEIAADFERAPQPVWSRDAARARILWANRAGLAFWQSKSVFNLAARGFDPDGLDARAMADAGANIAARLSPPGGTIRARLDIARAELPAVPRGRLVRSAGFDGGAHALSSALRTGEVASLDDAQAVTMSRSSARWNCSLAIVLGQVRIRPKWQLNRQVKCQAKVHPGYQAGRW